MRLVVANQGGFGEDIRRLPPGHVLDLLANAGRLLWLPAPVEDVPAGVQGTGEVEVEGFLVTVCQLSSDLGGILDCCQRLGLVAGRRQVRGEVMQELGPIRQVVSVYSRQVLVDAHELRRSGDRLIVSFEVVHADGQGV